MTEVVQQIAMSSSRSPRFVQWVAFLLFSTITLGSTVEMVRHLHNGSPRTAAEGWAIATSAITFTLTLISVLMHLSPLSSIYIVGTKIEGGICAALVIFWVTTVGVITNPRYALAVKNTGEVSNGNLYYFSWAGFVCSVTLSVSYLQSAFELDVAGEIQSRAARLTYWSALLATSLVVMGCSVDTFASVCAGNNDGDYYTYCRRTKFGIGLGLVATLSCTYVVASKIAFSVLPFMVEGLLSIALTVLYVFGVSYITSQEGPGAPLGNLYYFTWLSFLASAMISASCFEDYQASKSALGNTQAEQSENNDDSEIAVENLDDV